MATHKTDTKNGDRDKGLGGAAVERRLVFSPSARRPGCVLLQAVFGGTVDRDTFNAKFHSDTWLISATADMAAYPVTDAQLEQLSGMARAAVRGRK